MASTTRTIQVQEIHCESCENAIRRALGTLEGVNLVKPNEATNSVRVSFDPAELTEDRIRAALADVGYQPVD